MDDALVLPSLLPTPSSVGRTELREPVLASTRDCQRRIGDRRSVSQHRTTPPNNAPERLRGGDARRDTTARTVHWVRLKSLTWAFVQAAVRPVGSCPPRCRAVYERWPSCSPFAQPPTRAHDKHWP